MKWPDMVDVAEKAYERRERAIHIMETAHSFGLNANLPMVLRNYSLWVEWAEGRYNTGYLMRKTGVKRYANTTIRQDVGSIQSDTETA